MTTSSHPSGAGFLETKQFFIFKVSNLNFSLKTKHGMSLFLSISRSLKLSPTPIIFNSCFSVLSKIILTFYIANDLPTLSERLITRPPSCIVKPISEANLNKLFFSALFPLNIRGTENSLSDA